MNKNKQAFTLVELIITIIILAILGTIGFISLQGYSKTARDSTRISDLSAMKTSLELFHLDAGKYPNTTEGFDILYSGSTVWTQGAFGEKTKNNVSRLDKIPKDPLTDKEYTYSLTKTKQEYQLAGIMEGDEIGLVTKTNAAEQIATALVVGNYNGVLFKSETGTTCEVLSVPSIISSDGSTQTDLITILNTKTLVYHGYNNLPSNYKGSKYKSNGGFNFESKKPVVYSDNDQCKPLYAENSNARIELIKNLQKAYSGTLIENSDNIKSLVTVDINDIEVINKLSTVFVNNNLGGKLSTYKSDALVCETGEHTEDGLTCVPDTGTCEITNGTGIDTWNGTSWDCILNTCNIDYYNSGDGICSPVGIGYFSNSTDTTRTACTNFPDSNSRDYTYTSDGNGTNSCTATYTPKCGIDFYESTNGTCSAVGNGYYSVNLNNTRTACTNFPDSNSRDYTYTSDGNGTNSCTATYTPKCGIDFYESSNNICTAVGTGYYSPNLNNTKYTCTNNQDNNSRNYTYTGDGNGTNNCTTSYTAKCGIDLYESSNGVCSAVGTGYYSPNLNNSRISCTNKPANSTYSGDGNGINSCLFTCTSPYELSGSSCVINRLLGNIHTYQDCRDINGVVDVAQKLCTISSTRTCPTGWIFVKTTTSGKKCR